MKNNPMPLVHFVHGKDAGPWGTKINYLAAIASGQGFDVESLDYSGIDDPRQRAARLVEACRDLSRPLILVGSSMGGWVATCASNQLETRGLFLLAPAFYFPGYPNTDPGCPPAAVELVHGWRDEVILYEHSLRFGSKTGCVVHLVDDGHSLIDRLDLIGEYFSAFLRRIAQPD